MLPFYFIFSVGGQIKADSVNLKDAWKPAGLHKGDGSWQNQIFGGQVGRARPKLRILIILRY